MIAEFFTKCVRCRKTKENFLFTPCELSKKSPYCRKCRLSATKRSRLGKPTPQCARSEQSQSINKIYMRKQNSPKAV